MERFSKSFPHLPRIPISICQSFVARMKPFVVSFHVIQTLRRVLLVAHLNFTSVQISLNTLEELAAFNYRIKRNWKPNEQIHFVLLLPHEDFREEIKLWNLCCFLCCCVFLTLSITDNNNNITINKTIILINLFRIRFVGFGIRSLIFIHDRPPPLPIRLLTKFFLPSS